MRQGGCETCGRAGLSWVAIAVGQLWKAFHNRPFAVGTPNSTIGQKTITLSEVEWNLFLRADR